MARNGERKGAAGAGDSSRCRVLLPLPFDGPLDYAVPAGLGAAPGDFVEVPLGPRRLAGVVWDGDGDASLPPSRLKPIARLLDLPPMGATARRFIDWIAAYTMSPPGQVLRLFVTAANNDPPRDLLVYRATGNPPERLTAGRRRVLEAAAAGPLGAADLARQAAVGVGVVRALAEAGGLEATLLPPPGWPAPDPGFCPPLLSEAQAAAADGLRGLVAARRFQGVLLDGVTGSGKTEVYSEAIAEALRQGRQALVLLPEIALTAGLIGRFAARFGVPPALWHSDLAGRERRQVWRAVARGEVPLVVGARSALFLPFSDLGLVVVDEEHDPAFKQDEGVAYHGRDMAVVRASLEAIPVILASATPSLESLANVEAGRYLSLHLPERHGGAVPAAVELVDLRETPPERGSFLSPPVRAALAETLARGEQSLLFLNRRGYAPLTLCRRCGHRMECPNCTAWLVEHRYSRRLVCHHCGHGLAIPDRCPECAAEDSLVACGPGVERIADEVASVLPQARRLVMASDTLAGPQALAAAFEQISDRAVDIVIGTQVVAKGHHFPFLTLVGVVDADLGLAGGDLRAAERTFQMLTQVAGRAGRAERPGRALLQSWDPRQPVIQAIAAGNRDGFVATEAAARRRHGLPPYGRLVALVLSGPDPAEVMALGRALARTAPRSAELDVLGPAPAPLALLRGRHRVRLLVRAGRSVPVQAILAPWLKAFALPARIRLQVDVDPYNFM